MSLEELRAEVAALRQQVEELSFARDYIEIRELTSYYTHNYHMLKNEECPGLFAQKVPDAPSWCSIQACSSESIRSGHSSRQ
jgi:hypothetical protein